MAEEEKITDPGTEETNAAPEGTVTEAENAAPASEDPAPAPDNNASAAEKPVAAPETKKGRRIWPLFLTCWAAVLLALGLIGCAVLYQFLNIYEVTRPETLMDEMMDLMDAEDWLDKAEKNLDFELSEFEDAQTLYGNYRASLTTDQPLSYRSEKKATDSEHAVFVVRSGPSNLCTVELVPGGRRLPFGRHDWKLGRISSGDITKTLRSATVEIAALAAQEVCINDIPVSPAYLTDKPVEIEDLTDIESRMDEVPTMLAYRVGPVYGEIHVSADGRELAAEKSGRMLRYHAATQGTNSLTIRAPEDIRVTVGGAELKRKDVSESSYGLLEGLENYTGEEAYKTNTYRFTGLYSEPEVKAYAKNGEELRPIMSDEKVYNFFYPADAAADEEEQKELNHLQELAESYFNSYVDYTTKPFDGSIYYKLLNATLGGTQLQVYIAQSNATMQWAARSTVENQELRYDNLHRIGDSCFTCTVEFVLDKTSSTWVEEVSSSEANAEQMVFVRRGKYWYAAALSMIGD